MFCTEESYGFISRNVLRRQNLSDATFSGHNLKSAEDVICDFWVKKILFPQLRL
jgi:hypothetical protein